MYDVAVKWGILEIELVVNDFEEIKSLKYWGDSYGVRSGTGNIINMGIIELRAVMVMIVQCQNSYSSTQQPCHPN